MLKGIWGELEKNSKPFGVAWSPLKENCQVKR